MFEKAKVDLTHEDFYHINLKESIADAEENNRKLCNHVHGKTGNGNGFENPPQSTKNNYQSTTVKETKNAVLSL